MLSIYAKLYHKYEADKQFIPEGNLMEVKFEDFEADAMAMTEHIYKSLSIPGFEAAAPAISQYIGGKKGYKQNKYKYDDRTVRLVEENWKLSLIHIYGAYSYGKRWQGKRRGAEYSGIDFG